MQPDQELLATREHRLDAAVRAGKFTAERKTVYRALFDRDPQGTARLLDHLEPVPAFATMGSEDPLLAAAQDAFPELRRRGRRSSRDVPPVHAYLATPGDGLGDLQAASLPAPLSAAEADPDYGEAVSVLVGPWRRASGGRRITKADD